MGRRRTNTSRTDGGYGWVIVFGSFLTHFILLGLVRSYGILYVALLRMFGESATKTAALSSCFNTVRMLLAPFISVLCKRTSCRFSMICGGFIMMIGLVISAYAPNLDFLYLSYGVIGGIGGALVFAPPYIIIGQYFDKKKGIAMSLGTVGAGLGSSVMALVIVFLLYQYNYPGCMMILGAITLHNCIAGALFRPFVEKEPTICEEMAVTSFKPPSTEKLNVDSKSVPSAQEINELMSDDIMQVDHARESITFSNSTENTDVKRALDNKCQHNDNEIPISNGKQLCSTSESSNLAEAKKGLRGWCTNCCESTQKSLSLFANSTMVCYCLCIFMMPIAHGMVIFFVVDSAILCGATDEQAALIMTFFGICDATGRIGCGFIFDFKVFRSRRRLLFSILGIFVGIIVAVVGLMFNYVGHFIMACVFGIVAGGFHAQRLTIVSEFIPKQNLPDTVGISIFCQGLGNLVGPTIGGMTRDYFGNYDLAYYGSGIGLSLVCGVFLVDYLIKNKSNTNR